MSAVLVAVLIWKQHLLALSATAVVLLLFGAMFAGGRDDDRDGGAIGMLFAAIFAPIAAMLIQMAISRSREFMADRAGAEISGQPLSLARALQKISGDPHILRTATTSTAHLFISNPFKKKNGSHWLTNLFSTHPPIEERIRILRSM